jgi:hypothetical protein
MRPTRQFQRIVAALVVSIALNLIWIALDSSIDPRRYPPSIISRIVEVLGSPAAAFTEWFAPGHTGKQIVVLLISSIVFYAALSWVVLAVWAWLRRDRAE